MTIQRAFQAWMDTQRFVMEEPISRDDIKIRTLAWDTYCAIRDGYPANHYSERRARYGNPKTTDLQIVRIEENRRKLVH